MDHADGLLVQVVESFIVVCHVPRLLFFAFLSDLFGSVDFLPVIRAVLMIILGIVPFHDLVIPIHIPLRSILSILLLDLPFFQPKIIKPVEFLELNVRSLQVYLVQFHRKQLIEYALKVISFYQQKICPFR